MAVKPAKELRAIFSDNSLTGSKKLTEAGNVIKKTTKDYAQTINTKTAQLNVGKWGLTAAATGAGVGAGAFLTGKGVSSAVNDISDAAKTGFNPSKKSDGSSTGIPTSVILLIVGGIALYLMYQRIKRFIKKVRK